MHLSYFIILLLLLYYLYLHIITLVDVFSRCSEMIFHGLNFVFLRFFLTSLLRWYGAPVNIDVDSTSA